MGCRSHTENVLSDDTPVSPEEIARTFEELPLETPPEEVYKTFNLFCQSFFGAKTDSIYFSYGDQLSVQEKDSWRYLSERSATLAWETNLPAKTYVEYGESKRMNQKTEMPERYFFNHVHYLRNLEPGTLYYYRMISVDEFGNRIDSGTGTFRTQKPSGAIYIPGEHGTAPFILDQPNSTYILTEDITAEGTAFDIRAAGITLDLGANTVIHANKLIEDLDHGILEKSGVGVRWIGEGGHSGLKIFNGIIKQGKADNNREYLAGDDMLRPDPERKKALAKNSNKGFSNIEISGQQEVEIAGVTVEYHFPQTWGMRFEDAHGSYDIHHNVFLDKGTQMFNRHGAGGARSLGFQGLDKGKLNGPENQLTVHHNLIKRTRQNAINVAQEVFSNEIYVDSWVVNSFAVQPSRENGRVYDNKIFLTGYYSCGILWADKNLTVRDNFIHMESVRTMINPPDEGRRLIETWGEQDVLAGMRVTNYGKGGQKRENLSYENNIILGRSRKGAEMRGTEFFSDYSVKNLVFKNNTVKVMATDTLTTKAACVDTQGAFNDRSTHLPLYYKNSQLISNICNIRFGDEYGQGSNHHFINCTLTKIGNNPNYHTLVFDGGNSVFSHILLDCEFKNGAKYNDVYWRDTHSLSNYEIQWTFTLNTNPGARVHIVDKNGDVAFSGKAGPNGILSVPLTQSIIRPVEWTPGGKEVPVVNKSEHQEEVLWPYTVRMEYNGKEKTKTFEMTKGTELKILF